MKRRLYGLEYEGVNNSSCAIIYSFLSLLGASYIYILFQIITNSTASEEVNYFIYKYLLALFLAHAVYSLISTKSNRFIRSPISDFLGIMSACYFIPNIITFFAIRGLASSDLLSDFLRAFPVDINDEALLSDYTKKQISNKFLTNACISFIIPCIIPGLSLSRAFRDIFSSEKAPFQWLFICVIFFLLTIFLTSVVLLSENDVIDKRTFFERGEEFIVFVLGVGVAIPVLGVSIFASIFGTIGYFLSIIRGYLKGERRNV